MSSSGSVASIATLAVVHNIASCSPRDDGCSVQAGRSAAARGIVGPEPGGVCEISHIRTTTYSWSGGVGSCQAWALPALPEPSKRHRRGRWIGAARWWLADRGPAALTAREPLPGRELRPAEDAWCEKTHRQGPFHGPDAAGAGDIRGMSASTAQPVRPSRRATLTPLPRRRGMLMRIKWAGLLLAASFFQVTSSLAQQGPATGDPCSRWVICPGGLSSGIYPDCQCTDVEQPPVETCAANFPCSFPAEVSGDWPNCACTVPPPPPCKECGFGFIQGPFCSCIPVVTEPPG